MENNDTPKVLKTEIVKRPRGRPKIYTDEEIKEHKKLSYKKYIKKLQEYYNTANL